jgi:uncharacterized protein with HEPN domain
VSGRHWGLRLEDILECIVRIADYTKGMNEETFADDQKTIDAVIRNMAVIGEAARFIPAELEMQYPQIPWAKMRGFRNVVIHEYFGVSVSILWQTVQSNLPPLVPELKRILDDQNNH